MTPSEVECPECGGAGTVNTYPVDSECPVCFGAKTIPQNPIGEPCVSAAPSPDEEDLHDG